MSGAGVSENMYTGRDYKAPPPSTMGDSSPQNPKIIEMTQEDLKVFAQRVVEDVIESQEQVNPELVAAIHAAILADVTRYERNSILLDLPSRQKIRTLEDRLIDQATVINALNRSVGQLITHIGKYKAAAQDVVQAVKASADWARYEEKYCYITDSIQELGNVMRIQQAADLGPYEGVDFVNLAAEYVKLRDAARKVLAVTTAYYTGERMAEQEALNKLKAAMGTPDPITGKSWGIGTPMQVTRIAITENVKNLIDFLEPDTKLEALVYEKGKAVVTSLSAQLTLLKQAAEALLRSWPDTPERVKALRLLSRTVDRIGAATPQHEYQDPVGYVYRKLVLIRNAARGMIEAWNIYNQTRNKPAPTACEVSHSHATLEMGVSYLAAILERTQDERETP